MTSHQRHQRRGWMLVEILIVLAIIVIFLSAAGALFHLAVRTAHQSGERNGDVFRFQSALRALRADAWSATALAAPTPSQLLLTQPDGRSITWTYDAGTLTRRTPDTADLRRWPDLPPIAFATQGPAAIVREVSPDPDDNAPGELRLISQLPWLQETRP